MDSCDDVRSWLCNTFNIKVSDAWLAACLEWIFVENEGQNLLPDQLQSQVFDQWLLSDLSEIGEPVLPVEVKTALKMELVSNYPLQINSCIDAGFPLYGQKQKLQGRENPNEQVTADTSKPFQAAWEPKASQMLVVELTDGHTCIRGLEVERIAGLHTQLPSGTKVLITGTVVSRRGMLLLTAPHIQLLGGEVDALGEENTPLANLERAMAKSREDEGGHEKKEFSGKFLFRGDKKKLIQQNTSSKWSRNGNSFSASTSQSFSKQNIIKSDFKTNAQNLYGSNNQTGSGQSRNSSVKTKLEANSQKSQFQANFKKEEGLKQEDVLSEEWGDDLDYAELFNDDDDMMDDDDIELVHATSFQSTSVHHKTADTQRPSFSTLKQESDKLSENSMSISKLHTPHDDAEDNCMFDDDLDLIEAELSVTNKNRLKEDNFSAASNVSHSSNRLPWSSKVTCDSDNRKENLKSRPIPSTEKETLSVKPPQLLTKKAKQHLFKSSQNQAGSSPVILESNRHQSLQVSKNASKNPCATPSKLSLEKSSKLPKQRKLSDMFGAKTTGASQRSIDVKTGDNRSLSSHESFGSSSFLSPLPIFPKRSSGLSAPLSPTTPKAIVQPFKNEVFEFAGECENQPFSYLSEISTFSGGTSIIVKAYISTLTSRLNSSNGERWCLSCRINDGTDAVDVDLHSNILTQLIGFSAPDSMVMKQRLKTDPDIKDVLQEGLSGCQEKLSNTSCLMELELPIPTDELETSKPVLTKFIPLTEEHIIKLRDRLR